METTQLHAVCPARTPRRGALIVLSLLCVVPAGCGLFSRRQDSPFASGTPGADEVIAVVNGNADRVHAMVVHDLSISLVQAGPIPLVSLGGEAMLEKPHNFRLLARNPLTRSIEADIGSNQEEFWCYIKQYPERPTLLHASYADYRQARSSLPFEPDWVMESLGVLRVAPEENPIVQPGSRRGTVEIVSSTITPQGLPASKVTVVQLSSGWVVEKRLDVLSRRDGKPETIASSLLSKHRRDPASGAVYPGSIRVTWPRAGIDLTLQLNEVEFLPAFDAALAKDLWQMPTHALPVGAQIIDLGADARPPEPRRTPGTRLRPEIRGDDEMRRGYP